MAKCPLCGGKGKVEGTGVISPLFPMPTPEKPGVQTCPRCDGTGIDPYDPDDDDDKKDSKSSSWCFLTTACVEAMGLHDDCHELTALRRFRDSYVLHRLGGQQAVREYYALAPVIVAAIRETADPERAFIDIYHRTVAPVVGLIASGENERAFQLYETEIVRLTNSYLTTSPPSS